MAADDGNEKVTHHIIPKPAVVTIPGSSTLLVLVKCGYVLLPRHQLYMYAVDKVVKVAFVP